METNERGWYQKYIVSKADGSAVEPNADYFVLRLDKDPAALDAVLAYARSCGNKALHDDIIKRVSCYDVLEDNDVNQPVKVTPNMKVVNAITNRLSITCDQCPCVPQDQWCEDTLCPCKNLRETGECHCGLFVKE